MSDAYERFQTSLTSPAIGGFAVIPHDTNELFKIPRALRIGSTAGTLAVIFLDGAK